MKPCVVAPLRSPEYPSHQPLPSARLMAHGAAARQLVEARSLLKGVYPQLLLARVLCDECHLLAVGGEHCEAQRVCCCAVLTHAGHRVRLGLLWRHPREPVLLLVHCEPPRFERDLTVVPMLPVRVAKLQHHRVQARAPIRGVLRPACTVTSERPRRQRHPGRYG